MFFILSIIIGLVTLAGAWLPEAPPSRASLTAYTGTPKIRGVNAGSQYIVEAWMVGKSRWEELGCHDGTDSERLCIERDQDKDVDRASTAWEDHWNTWITQNDIRKMVSYGLNTIRIPVGFWMKEDLLNETEHFPRGGMKHLIQFCGWASDADMYIIIDLHGLPGRQSRNPTGQVQSFTGDTTNNTLGFYQSDYESGRAYEFLEWMIEHVHTNHTMRNVGAIELINEPIQEVNEHTRWMVEKYYTSAVDRIRDREKELDVQDREKPDIVVMDKLWGSGPAAYDHVHSPLLFDDHNYQEEPIDGLCKGDQSCALDYTCNGEGNRLRGDGEDSKFVGEWSMKLKGFPLANNDDFFRQYFSAQQSQYEKTRGWVFWNWRVDGIDDGFLWSYKDAVTRGIIDTNLDRMRDKSPC